MIQSYNVKYQQNVIHNKQNIAPQVHQLNFNIHNTTTYYRCVNTTIKLLFLDTQEKEKKKEIKEKTIIKIMFYFS